MRANARASEGEWPRSLGLEKPPEAHIEKGGQK